MSTVSQSKGSNVGQSTTVRPRRKGMSMNPNECWRERLRWIEKFLDVETMLSLRGAGRLFYNHKYKTGGHLLFSPFRGYDPKILCDQILSLTISSLHESERENGLKLDFSLCTLLKDTSIAHIMEAIHGDMEDNRVRAKVKALYFNYCYQITDQGLAAMLTTNLPYLEELSIRCARSKELTGSPFVNELTPTYWPAFVKFDCSFSNMWLTPITSVANAITYNAGVTNKKMELKIYGSWGSTCLFKKLSLETTLRSISVAVKSKNHEAVSKLTKKIQRDIMVLSDSDAWKDDALLQLLKNCGSKLVVNAPLTVESSVVEGVVQVWTLPISLAIQHGDEEMFSLLLKRGAEVNVWDYLGKSPLFTACECDSHYFAEALTRLGVSALPYDLSGLSALDVAIKRNDLHKIQLLLQNGGVLNYKCPALRKFKSALFVACEANSSEVIRILLEKGADPNWNSPTRCTSVMLAYKLSASWLPQFLECGAGAPKSKRWVLAEVLGCAIAKSDIHSIDLLVNKFPDLMTRPHHIWSLPHIQAAKLGNVEVLQYFLDNGVDADAVGDDGATALHVATAENSVTAVRLLLDAGADINKTTQEGQTALHIACIENHEALVQLLVERNADSNILDNTLKETPLMSSIRRRNSEAALYVIRNSSSFNCDTMSGDGRTSLMYAVFYGQYEVADELISNGANVTVTDHFGISLCSIVCERMMNPRSEKRVLKRLVRHYKAAVSRSPSVSTLESESTSSTTTKPSTKQALLSKSFFSSKPFLTKRSVNQCKADMNTRMESDISVNSAELLPYVSSGVKSPATNSLNLYEEKTTSVVGKKMDRKSLRCRMLLPMELLKVAIAK